LRNVGTTLNLYAASIRKPFLLIISMAAKALKLVTKAPN